MVTRVAADKGVLKWARERNKLSIESAATLLKCNVSLLEKIEKGDLSPNATLFRRMSDVYVLPESYPPWFGHSSRTPAASRF
jgi:transcriptional regulator with XRE-family HTH domain